MRRRQLRPPAPVPVVVHERDGAQVRVAQNLGDRSSGNAGVSAEQPLAGDDEIQVQPDEQAEQPLVVVLGDLRERVVQQDQPRCARPVRIVRGGGRGRRGGHRQVGDELLLALREPAERR